MTALTVTELVRMRRDSRTLMPDIVECWRRTLSSDSKGGRTETWARVSTGPGRLSPVKTIAGADVMIGSREGAVQGWTVTLTPEREVRLADRLKVRGRTFEVTTSDEGRAYNIVQRLQTVEVT